jgi:hypothetical protein
MILWEASARERRGFNDPSKFPRHDNAATNETFIEYIAEKGMLRPDLMPRCRRKLAMLRFLNQLSSKYFDLFSKITVAVYINEYFFEAKQLPVVTAYGKLNRPPVAGSTL